MNIAGSTVLVTGASGGLGAALCDQFLGRGAASVYAAARDVSRVQVPGAIPVQVDITDPESVGELASRCQDVDIVLNNAGTAHTDDLFAASGPEAARLDMSVNYFGTLAMTRAFAPVLAGNGGGALVNVLSVVAWFSSPARWSYAASKAAAWSLTNATRVALRPQGTLVTGVFASWIDTSMAADVDGAKAAPSDVAGQIIDAVESGAEEVLADQRTRDIKQALPDDLNLIYPDVEKAWRRTPR